MADTLESLQNPAWTYSLTVDNIKVKQEGTYTNSIIQTYWKYTATDTASNTGVFVGATPLTATNQPEGYEFIPFEQLDEAEVVSWIKELVIDGYAQHIHGIINEQIDQKVNVVSAPNMPWSTATSVTSYPPV